MGYDIWISEKLNFDYFDNEKSFLNQIKDIPSSFTNVLSLRLTKQTSRNVVDTTFKQIQ